MLLAASSPAVASCRNCVQWARSRGIIAGKEGIGKKEIITKDLNFETSG